jgi:hypothetical protein
MDLEELAVKTDDFAQELEKKVRRIDHVLGEVGVRHQIYNTKVFTASRKMDEMRRWYTSLESLSHYLRLLAKEREILRTMDPSKERKMAKQRQRVEQLEEDLETQVNDEQIQKTIVQPFLDKFNIDAIRVATEEEARVLNPCPYEYPQCRRRG